MQLYSLLPAKLCKNRVPPVAPVSEQYVVIYYILGNTVIQKKAEH